MEKAHILFLEDESKTNISMRRRLYFKAKEKFDTKKMKEQKVLLAAAAAMLRPGCNGSNKSVASPLNDENWLLLP